jgi:DNA-binding HxlR family transcriptional regulator
MKRKSKKPSRNLSEKASYTLRVMKRDENHVEATLRVIGRKGTLQIFQELRFGAKRFTALEKALGVSPRTLSERLKELEEQAIVERRAYAEVPPRVEYILTEKGHTLSPLIEAVREWERAWGVEESAEAARELVGA